VVTGQILLKLDYSLAHGVYPLRLPNRLSDGLGRPGDLLNRGEGASHE
jgi:hypothetical protein